MRVAVFGDVHGNLPALTAALADMDAHSPDVRVCLGDVTMGGAWPRECLHTDSVCFVWKSGQRRFPHSTSGIRFSPARFARISRCFQHLSIGVRIRWCPHWAARWSAATQTVRRWKLHSLSSRAAFPMSRRFTISASGARRS
nr:metallophosphoesterase family protein [Deinococcus radiopugnans]